MLKVNIDLPIKSYPVYIDTSYDNFAGCMYKADLRGKAVLVTDKNVDGIYSEALVSKLKLCSKTCLNMLLSRVKKAKH